MTSYGTIRLVERRLTLNKTNSRPFSEVAGIHCRDYSRTLQRRIVDFAADGSFANAVRKLKEHYGIIVPEASVRAITLKHARCMEEIDNCLLDDCQPCLGEGKQFVGEMDGSFIPVVLINENSTGDKRKSRKLEWKEARLGLVHELGSTEKRHTVTLGSVDEAGERWLGCAIRQGLNRQSKIHCVSDGAPWIASQAERVFAGQGSYLVDFYHTSDYLADAAKERRATLNILPVVALWPCIGIWTGHGMNISLGSSEIPRPWRVTQKSNESNASSGILWSLMRPKKYNLKD